MKRHLLFSLLAVFGLLPFVSIQLLAADIPLANHGDSWRWRKGTNAPQSDWKSATAVLDGTWLTGNGGIGYADNANETTDCQTLLTDMDGFYRTIYMRRQFTVSSAVDTNLHLRLTMDFDDGFIAWLDGAYLTSVNVTGAPNEPAFNTLASGSHESSRGNTAPTNPAQVIDLGTVSNRLSIGTHVLSIIGLNNTLGSSDLIIVPDLVVASNASPTCISGPIGNTTWYRTNSPIQVCGSVTVNNGATLTIEPGVTVQLAAGADIIVANGGRILAEGTSVDPIHFTRSGTANWGNITINGAVGSPETRITHALLEFNGGSPCIDVQAGTVLLDHLSFGNPAISYIHVDDASFVISDCYFPPATAAFELLHGTGGVRSDGRGIFLRNFFGKARSYNDVVDFTGGNRPGSPIVQFINNVVTGSDDDAFDLDGTDAWVEGNIFLHMHKNGSTPDSASGVSGGNDGANTSQITVIRNIFFDCDQAADAKQGNFFTFLNNTIVHQSHIGGIDTDGAVVALADAGTTEGVGMYLEGNIIYDIEKLTRNVVTAVVTFSNNILPIAYGGPGGGNSVTNPLLKHVPLLSETAFTSWADAQVLWDWFSLQTNSPAIATGPNGSDKGAVIPHGVHLSGVPDGLTPQTGASIVVGINRTGSSIPTAGFPLGSGYTHYKWRLDGASWSPETSINTLLSLSGLGTGPHYLEVSGKNDAGLYQDDPALGSDANVTRSATWWVSPPLGISIFKNGSSSVDLQFTAESNLSYTIQYRNSLAPGSPDWQTRAHFDASNAVRSITWSDSVSGISNRFYRLSAP